MHAPYSPGFSSFDSGYAFSDEVIGRTIDTFSLSLSRQLYSFISVKNTREAQSRKGNLPCRERSYIHSPRDNWSNDITSFALLSSRQRTCSSSTKIKARERDTSIITKTGLPTFVVSHQLDLVDENRIRRICVRSS